MDRSLASSRPEEFVLRPDDAPETVPVLLPYPLAGAYDYRVPEKLLLSPGDFVEVPLGPRSVVGVVWDEGERADVEPRRLKSVLRRLDAPPMRAPMRRLVRWVGAYTLTPPGAVLRMAMSVGAALEPPRPVPAFRLTGTEIPADFRQTGARRRILALLGDGFARPAADVARETGAGTAVLHGLERAGLVERVGLPSPALSVDPDWRRPGPQLSGAQGRAVDLLRERVEQRRFSAVLLDGVTGSGKTEVYFEAMAAALAEGRQALVLLPEIALTAQWLDRFAARFGVRPGEWHSELTPARRRDTWRGIAEGTVRVAVGARSALFLPFPDLGVIVVDEEHEQAFKQEDGVAYHARDMAVVRAHLEAIPIVLASATPSLESLHNVEIGRYETLRLPDRHAGALMPDIAAIDMRRTPPARGRWLSPPLLEAVGETLAAGEQVLLFLNRRGYAPLTLCRACGHRFQCPNCTAWLVEHRFHQILQCHHCGFAMPPPDACPGCGAEGSLVACGPGVERLAEEVALLFPDARTGVMASDLLAGPRAAAELVRRVTDHEIDILIGTQVVAKGHHFPMLTLVGVVDADLGLAGGDLRAAERTWQLLSQVAGRAGRAERPGRVLLQTWQPEAPVMEALVRGDRDGFVATEMDNRRRSGMPPFGRLAALILSGPEAAEVESSAKALARTAPHGPDLRMLGPAPAPLALLRGQHRWRLLLQTARHVNVQEVLHRWLGETRIGRKVRLQIDVDPHSFM